jgi:hypothetical protein
MIKTASVSFSKTWQELTADLDLSAAQTSALSKVFKRREKELAQLLSGSDQAFPGNDGETLKRICALLRHKGLRAELADLLSKEQLESFDRREERRVQSRLEARAYRDLAKVNEVAELSGEQKQEVFDALLKAAPAKVEEEANARAFMSLTYGPLAAEMDPSVVTQMTGLINPGADGQPDVAFGSGEYSKWQKEQQAGRIERELALLEEVLNSDQLTRYREHLEGR